MNNSIYQIFLFAGLLFTACNQRQPKETPRIFYVNSYHIGYGSSDDVMAGINETIAGKNVEIKTYFLDAKRKTSDSAIMQSVNIALLEMEQFNPDVLVVSDDNAVRDLIVPYFNNTALPVVYCGVNWSAAQYQLGENVTGMLEVLPLREMLTEVISNYPETKKLAVLSENSLSEQNNRTLLDTLYRNLGLEVTYYFANDFSEWKRYFMEASKSVDLFYIPTNGAIKNWNEEEAKVFVFENLKIPVVTCDDFMMPYAVFGLTKIAKEQGEWAAETVLQILDGKKPGEIPQASNQQTAGWINTPFAKKINFRISENRKKQCKEIQ
jgi:ABC-type uncharacterized transport system substrate-binding protein